MSLHTTETFDTEMKKEICIVDCHSLKILYTNRMDIDLKKDTSCNKHCYEIFKGQEAPCKQCPLKEVADTRRQMCSVVKENTADGWAVIQNNDLQAAEHHYLWNGVRSVDHLLNNVQALIFLVDVADYRLSYVNKMVKELLPDTGLGELCYKALWGRNQPCTFCPLKRPELVENEQKIQRYNKKMHKYLSVEMVEVKSTEDKQQAVFVAYDISRLRESENRLKQVAYTDGLTNIKNRNAFLESVENCYVKKKKGCIAVLNIKNLKRYNLYFGRRKGDALICKVASLFADAYQGNKVFRIDGAKIAFVAQGESEIQILKKVINKTQKQLINEWNDADFNLVFDVAFVFFPGFSKTPEEAVHHAEYLLRANSKSVDGQTLEFNEFQQNRLRRREQIERILRKGNYSEKFQIFYQPIYDIKQDGYYKCEALLRMKDDELGIVSPAEFIPIAEESGYIYKLDKFVLNEVCSFLADRILQDAQELTVSVNVSSMEYSYLDYYSDVTSIVQYWDVPPRCIQFEVTESILINSMEKAIQIMKRLIDYGFSFAIDDFGTGYSNLSYIGLMPVECLKLDKSFMDMLTDSDSYKFIISNVIEMARGLKLSVVAEGIERTEQYEIIKELGSNYIQGYLFSMPLPRVEFEKFLESNGGQRE